MSTTVPYDPEDFDNNPFSEQVIKTVDAGKQPKYSNPQGGQGQSSITSPFRLPTDSNQEPSYHITTKVENELVMPTETEIRRFIPERFNQNRRSICLVITDIEKNGTDSSAFKNPVIKFDAFIKGLNGFRKNSYKDIRRTYKELESFAKYLNINNIEVFVPGLPSIPTLYNMGSPEFKSSVSKLLQEWMNRITKNPILIKDHDFVLFLETNDFSYSPTKTMSQSIVATGLRRKTLKQLAPPFDACRRLAEFRPLVKSLYIVSQKLVSLLERIGKLDKNMNGLYSIFYRQLRELSMVEVEEDMPRLWTKLEKVMQLFNELDLMKRLSYNSALNECLLLVIRDSFTIKESLTNRHLLMRELSQAKDSARKKFEQVQKLKSKPIIDTLKADEASQSLEAVVALEKELEFKVDRLTYNMLIESEEYLNYFTETVRTLFRTLAYQQIQFERKKLALLANAKLIDVSHSLHRLGRESLPLRKDPNRIEAWSGGSSSRNSTADASFERDMQEYETYLDNDFDTVLPVLNPSAQSSKKKVSTQSAGNNLTEFNAKNAANLLGGTTF
ncbi:hypothetical protein LJB42_001440 [Komagataella kurtzmanii]|nr:hypothetical protein LJB42_001440 [Komagataella kurtzmanii]